MKRMALMLVVLSCLTAFPCSQSFASYAGLLAPANKFRTTMEFGLAQRAMEGHYYTANEGDTLVVPLWSARFQYGFSSRLRSSTDVMAFRVVMDDDDGSRELLEYYSIGFSLQGVIWRWREKFPLEATAKYRISHASGTGDVFPNGTVTERVIALTLVREFSQSRANRLYFGPLYFHHRWERYGNDLRWTAHFASNHDVGLIAGGDVLLFRHLTLNAEGFYTGDYGGSGSLGWEF